MGEDLFKGHTSKGKMADKIDMSLDDIIKKNKLAKKAEAKAAGSNNGAGAKEATAKGAGPKVTGPKGVGPKGAKTKGGGQAKGKPKGKNPKAGVTGKVTQGGDRGQGGQGQGGGGRTARGTGRKRGGGAGANWGRGGGVPIFRTKKAATLTTGKLSKDGPKRGAVLTTGGPCKLVVSNLDFGVSDSDINELFTELGKLKAAVVHYDRNGRSQGTADVVFERKSDAIKAMKKYNGVPLDGRPMQIAMAASAADLQQALTLQQSVPKGAPERKKTGAGGRVEKKNINITAKKGKKGGNKGGGGKKEGGLKQEGGEAGKDKTKKEEKHITFLSLHKEIYHQKLIHVHPNLLT